MLYLICSLNDILYRNRAALDKAVTKAKELQIEVTRATEQFDYQSSTSTAKIDALEAEVWYDDIISLELPVDIFMIKFDACASAILQWFLWLLNEYIEESTFIVYLTPRQRYQTEDSD